MRKFTSGWRIGELWNLVTFGTPLGSLINKLSALLEGELVHKVEYICIHMHACTCTRTHYIYIHTLEYMWFCNQTSLNLSFLIQKTRITVAVLQSSIASLRTTLSLWHGFAVMAKPSLQYYINLGHLVLPHLQTHKKDKWAERISRIWDRG